MAEAKKTSHKPNHPAFSRMICEAMHAMDETHVGEEHHNHPGHSLQSLKKYIGEHYEMSNGWEKRLNNAVKMMLQKKQLAHAAGHMGSYRLSKSMAAKEEKRLKRKPRQPKEEPKAEAEAEPEPEAPKKKAPKRKAAKMEGPAKRAKKAAPKKAAAKKA